VGHGKATAALFARNGAHVVCVDVNREAAQETVDIIQGEGRAATAFACDVTDSEAVKAVVDGTAWPYRRASQQCRLFDNGVPSNSTKQLRVEPSTSTSPVASSQRRSGAIVTGAIVNVSSVAAIRYTGYSYVAYYAAKAAVNSFTMGLALQYARDGIRANAVIPGLMNTPLIVQQISGQYLDGGLTCRIAS
jgi:NAD(P)-dependent dehydrogenase (short-subunit alcohol dehydrogenase family)